MIFEDRAKSKTKAHVEWPGPFGGIAALMETATASDLVIEFMK